MAKEKEIIALGKEHIELVDKLKKSLMIGQVGFLRAGKILSEIKEKRTYTGEDLSHEWSWKDFCARPDIPLPGSTDESRLRVADNLIRVFKTFVQKLGYQSDALGEIGWVKLALVAPKCADADAAEDWLSKAANLTLGDLRRLLKGEDVEISCGHGGEYPIFYCPCGSRSKQPMNKKHKSIPESAWKK